MVLGRSAGLTEEQMAHVLDDPLPDGVYTPELAAIVRYARASTVMKPIDDATWNDLANLFDVKAVIDVIFIVGLNQMISRFHAAIRTEVDEHTLVQVAMSCPVPVPKLPPSEAGPAT